MTTTAAAPPAGSRTPGTAGAIRERIGLIITPVMLVILASLDNDLMQELNRQVNEDGADPEDVARQYLIDQGLIQG